MVGPGTVEPPAGPAVVRVTTADEMRRAVLDAAADADAVVMAAAVADFRPETAADGKLKKDQGPPRCGSSRPPTSSPSSARAGGTVLVGFAAETRDVEASGREKLRRKGVQLLVANEVGREGTGFGSDTNRAAILAADGEDVADARVDQARARGGDLRPPRQAAHASVARATRGRSRPRAVGGRCYARPR